MTRSQQQLAPTMHDEVHALIPLNLSSSTTTKANESASNKLQGRVVFITDKGAGKIWGSTIARDALFTRIMTDTHGSLGVRKVVRIETLGPGGKVIYSYAGPEGQKVYKAIEAEGEAALTSYKVQTLSLPTFSHGVISSAIPAVLRGCLDLLKMPITFLQRTFKGPSEAEKFAHALTPPTHDRVGEKTHEDVLFQLKFVSRFFSTHDQRLSKALTSELVPTKSHTLRLFKSHTLRLFGQHRPAKQTKEHYEVLLSSHTLEMDEKGQGELKWSLNERSIDTWVINPEELEDIQIRVEQSGKKPSWVPVSQLKKEELPFEIQPFEEKQVRYVGRTTREEIAVKKCRLTLKEGEEDAPFSTWIRILKTSESTPYSFNPRQEALPPKNESKFFSAGDRVSSLLLEAHDLGHKIYSAHQSQNPRRVEACIDDLTTQLMGLNERKPPLDGYLIIPVALGEGKNYLPHFLVFETLNKGGLQKIFVKHICITRTARETKKVQIIRTYDISRLKEEGQCKAFATRLMNLQPYKRKKDPVDNQQVGPTNDDLALDQLLLQSGNLLNEQTAKCKPSGDPIKLMFHLASQLSFSPQENSALDTTSEELKSKAYFYKTYVNHLVSHYQTVESSLSAQDKERALRGIEYYTNKVSHYMEKELGVAEALAITKPLSDCVERHLEGYQRRKQLEKEDLSRLNRKATLFKGKLDEPLSEESLRRTDQRVVVEGSRVSHKQWTDVQAMAKMFREPSISEETGTATFQKKKIHAHFASLLDSAEGLLRTGETRAAKALLVSMLEALVLPQSERVGPDVVSKITFWDTLRRDELLVWQKQLYLLAEKTMEASLRSGQYPLAPQEAFDFNVVLPAIQRYLLGKRIPMMMKKFQDELKAKMTEEGSVKKLEERRTYFLRQRDVEIENSVREELNAKWEKEDAEDKEREKAYKAELAQHRKAVKAYQAYERKNQGRIHLDPPGPPPQELEIATPEEKVKIRAREKTAATNAAEKALHDKWAGEDREDEKKQERYKKALAAFKKSSKAFQDNLAKPETERTSLEDPGKRPKKPKIATDEEKETARAQEKTEKVEAALAELQSNWELEDAEDKQREALYQQELAAYTKEVEAYQAYLKRQKAELPPLDPPGPPPQEPDIATAQEKAETRALEEAEKIKAAKKADSYRIELVKLKKRIPQFGQPGKFIKFLNSYSQIERCQAVMGSFLQILGVDRASIGYFARQTTTISQTLIKSDSTQSELMQTFQSILAGGFDRGEDFLRREQEGALNKELQFWLMSHDHSLLVGATPDWEQRYHECREAFSLLYQKYNPLTLENVQTKQQEGGQALNLIIGYRRLGDGTRMPLDSPGFIQKGLQFAEKTFFESTVNAAIEGYFEGPHGEDFFVPEETSLVRKTDEMRKLLAKPELLIESNQGFMDLLQNGMQTDASFVRKALSKKNEIHLVSKIEKQAGVLPRGAFTLSESPHKEGSLVLSRSKEFPAETSLRHKEIGELRVRTVDTFPDREIAAVDIVRDAQREPDYYDYEAPPPQSFRRDHLDKIQEVVLWASSMGIDINTPSYLAAEQCFHFMYQYPEKVASNAVRDFLLKTIFQEGLIQDLLKHNPNFFIENKKFFFELITQLKLKAREKPASKSKLKDVAAKKQGLGDNVIDPEEYSLTEIWLRDIFDRILNHAEVMFKPNDEDSQEEKDRLNHQLEQFRSALPSMFPVAPKSKKQGVSRQNPIVVSYFLSYLNTKRQKAYATYVLSYYSRNIPEASNAHLQDWINILNAYYLMNQSPFVGIHSGVEHEVDLAVLSKLLPKVEKKLRSTDPQFRNDLLGSLTGFRGEFQSKSNTPYVYLLKKPDGRVLEVDLRTGTNFALKIETGDRGYLPIEVLSDPNFLSLFRDCGTEFSPFVKSTIGANGIIDFRFDLEKDGTRYLIRFNRFTKASDIYQISSGNYYLYATRTLSSSLVNKTLNFLGRGSQNRTVQKLIEEQGIWVPVDTNFNPEPTTALVTQGGRELEKDPITLHIQKRKIVEATIGKGKDLKSICSSLRNQRLALLSFCSPSGLLLLSKDGVHIDEIRFPKPKNGNDKDSEDSGQFILARHPKQPNVWTLKDQTNWVLELTDTGQHEKRFGKHWREYVCPLRNVQSGDYDYWIFPYPILKKGKRGDSPQFLKSITDLLQSAGATFNHVGLSVPGKALGLLAGVTSTFETQLGGADDLGQALQGSKFAALGKLGGMISGLTEVAPSRYRVGETTSCSHMGFLYLADQAAFRGEWGGAAHYLDLAQKHGYSNKNEALALRNYLAKSSLIDTLLAGDERNVFEILQSSSVGPFEAAYRMKRALMLLRLKDRLAASFQVKIFKFEEFKEGLGSPETLKENLFTPDNIFGTSLLLQMESLLKNFAWGFENASTRRMLEDFNLVPTPSEYNELQIRTNLFPLNVFDLIKRIKQLFASNSQEGESDPLLALPPLTLPTEKELEVLIPSVSSSIASHAAWSIDDLHKTQGATPKKITVVSHFWDYMLWILKNDLTYDQVAFLSTPLNDEEIEGATDLVDGLVKAGKQVMGKVQGKQVKDEHEPIDIARRTLLAWWMYCKKIPAGERDKNSAVMEQLLKSILRMRENLPDFAAMQQKASSLEAQALLKPGLWNSTKAFFYPLMIKGDILASQVEATVDIGGIPHKRGPAADFNQIQRLFLIEKMLPALDRQLEIKTLTPPDLILREEEEALATRRLTPDQQEAFDGFFQSEELKPMAAAIHHLLQDRTRRVDLEERWLRFLASPSLPLDTEQDWRRDLVPVLKSLVNETAAENPLIARQKPDLHASIERGQIRNLAFRILETYNEPASKEPVESPPLRAQKIPPRYRETITIEPSSIPDIWTEHFVQIDPSKVLKEKADQIKNFFSTSKANDDRERNKLTGRLAVIDEVTQDLISRRNRSLNAKNLGVVTKQLETSVVSLKEKQLSLRKQILDFTWRHARDLGFLQMFSDPNRFSEEQIIEKTLDLYQEGQLGLLGVQELQNSYAQHITDYLLVSTEIQQYEKAYQTCKELDRLLQNAKKQAGVHLSADRFWSSVQHKLNQSVDWILNSAELMRQLTEGNNYLRHAEMKGGTYRLQDQQFDRRFLVTERRNKWISRRKAIDSLQQLVNELREGEKKGKPARLILAKMGTGKTYFIFKKAIQLLIAHGKEPVMITNDELLDQMAEALGQEHVFKFYFDINFGLKATSLTTLSEQEKMNYYSNVSAHLRNIHSSLQGLARSQKVVLTSPSQYSSVRNKRVQLQALLKETQGEERRALFSLLQQVKLIESYFCRTNVVKLIDENSNLEIGKEHNYATGNYRKVDPIRVNDAEKLIRTAQSENKNLWGRIVKNDLRGIQNPDKEFEPVLLAIFADTKFWTSLGWEKEVWEKINKKHLTQYVLGKRPTLPKHMPLIEEGMTTVEQRPMAYVGAFKTLMTAFCSVNHTNPNLERGLAPDDGVSVIPYDDGEPKADTVFGEESELLFHILFHYMGTNNKLDEEIFWENYKTLRVSESKISPHYSETWVDWAGKIGEIVTKKGYPDGFAALQHAPELSLQRLQYARHLLGKDYVRVYHEQISFNSQDIGVGGEDVRVGSGTGSRFNLNLADEEDPDATDDQSILVETLMCTVPNRETTLMQTSALLHIAARAKDPMCIAILDYDYEVMNGDAEKLVVYLRQKAAREGTLPRDFIYRDLKNVKKIWKSGALSPTEYDPTAINPDKAFFIYFRKDSRGVHFEVPRGGNHYAEAMVGCKNLEDNIAQMVWRQRHLDLGHSVRYTYDKNTADHVRDVNGLGEADLICEGHLWYYFFKNTLEHDRVMGLKAFTFSLHKLLKASVDAVVRTPYDLGNPDDTRLSDRSIQEGVNQTRKAISNTKLLEAFEGNVVMPSVRDLYILDSTINWAHEYQPTKQVDIVEYAKAQLEREENRLESMQAGFEKRLQKLLTHEGTLAPYKKLYETLSPRMTEKTDLEQFFTDNLPRDLRNQTYEEFLTGMGILKKALGLKYAFVAAKANIEKEQAKLDTEARRKYLYNNLHPTAPLDAGSKQRNEQQVQQQVEQEKEVEQQQTEQQLRASSYTRSTKALKVPTFIDFTKTSTVRNAWSYDVHEIFTENNELLPVAVAFPFPESHTRHSPASKLPEFYDARVCISHRAYVLLEKMAENGAPLVEILVFEKPTQEGYSQFYSVIVTPSERENTIARFLEGQRTKNSPYKLGVYALSNEKFPQLLMDRGGQRPDEDHPDFTSLIILNKLLLNWQQFSLEELDLLYVMLEKLSEGELSQLRSALVHACSGAMADRLARMMSADKPDLEWELKVAKRRLLDGMPFEKFRAAEKVALKAWTNTYLPTHSQQQTVRDELTEHLPKKKRDQVRTNFDLVVSTLRAESSEQIKQERGLQAEYDYLDLSDESDSLSQSEEGE